MAGDAHDAATGDLSHRLMRAQMRALAALAKQLGAAPGDLAGGLHRLTEAAAQILQVRRLGVWRFDEGRTTLECLDLFDAAARAHEAGARVAAADNPRYFEALDGERVLVADDAQADPRLAELVDTYLRPFGVTSMLDAPIRIRGRIAGVVCHEHIGPRRIWTALEQTLAGTFADFAGLAIEAHESYVQEARARRLEDQLRQAQKLESLGVLAGGVAHDFNNLLVGILGNAGLCLLDLPEGSPLRPLLLDIQSAATQAAELAQEMLAYSGKATFETASLALGELCREVAPLLRRRLGPAVALSVEVPGDLPAVLGDAAQLRHVLSSLVQNSADAIGEGPGTIAVRARVLRLPPLDTSGLVLGERLIPGEYVALEVRDSGVGMDEVVRAHLFDPFFTTKATGRGLGLAVVLGIVAGHRGALSVESAPGQGAAVTVYLPATAQPPQRRSEPPTPPIAREAAGTVLVADDEAIVRTVTRRVLERAGYRVIEAEDGVAALERFDAHRGALAAIVLDLTMPRLGGQEVLQRIRAVDGEVRVLLTSGFSQEALAQGVADGPGIAFLQKPFSPSALLARLDALRARR